jgi:hypothetical protein
MTIKYPERSEGRAAFRRVIEAAAQATPVTAALAHLYGYTHPSEFEQARERCLLELVDSASSHEEKLARIEDALAPRARLSELALDVAFLLLRLNTTGSASW